MCHVPTLVKHSTTTLFGKYANMTLFALVRKHNVSNVKVCVMVSVKF